MESILERILSYYGLNKEDYAAYAAEPSFSSLPRLSGHLGVELSKQRIIKAKESKEKVIVYGDYDTDGIMATSIMVKLLRRLGCHVSFYLPSRYLDGYGLTMANAEKIVSNGYKLVILVDNGITLVDEIVYLRSKGVDVIVIDHHEYAQTLPPIQTIIHPIYSSYGEIPVSAGYLCFIFSLEFFDLDDYLLCLGALSTVSDMMPIKGYNREIVRLMLQILNSHPAQEFVLLSKQMTFDEKSLSMQIIPQINAIGRMDEEHRINRLVHYFADGDKSQLPILANWMNEVNERRKMLTRLAEERLSISKHEPAIVVTGDLPEGLNGLLANKLLNQYQKVTAVFSSSKSDPSLYVGSLRCLDGFDFIECANALSKYLVRFGGHAKAGGMSLKKIDYPAFRKAFMDYAFAHPVVSPDIKRIPLYIEEANLETYHIISVLSPFGQEFKEPIFLLEHFPLEKCQFTMKGGYLSVMLNEDTKLFSFSFKQEDVDARCQYIDLSLTFGMNEFRGKSTLTLFADVLKQY